MNYSYYADWCERTGRHILVSFGGTIRMNALHYRDDGNLWIGKGRKAKKIGPYLLVARYRGTDMLVRYAERGNLHRFENLRWTVLCHIQNLHRRMAAVEKELRKQCQSGVAIGSYRDVWWRLSLYDSGIQAERANINGLPLLDRMAVVTRSGDDELRLVAQYLRLRERVQRYYTFSYRLDSCLGQLFFEQHPHKASVPWTRPKVTFVVNGRRYFVSEPTTTAAPEWWPSPMTETVILDATNRDESTA